CFLLLLSFVNFLVRAWFYTLSLHDAARGAGPHRLDLLGGQDLLGDRLEDRLDHRSTGADHGDHGAQAVADVLLRRTVPARGGGGARHAAVGLRGAGRRSEGTPRPAHRWAARVRVAGERARGGLLHGRGCRRARGARRRGSGAAPPDGGRGGGDPAVGVLPRRGGRRCDLLAAHGV